MPRSLARRIYAAALVLGPAEASTTMYAVVVLRKHPLMPFISWLYTAVGPPLATVLVTWLRLVLAILAYSWKMHNVNATLAIW